MSQADDYLARGALAHMKPNTVGQAVSKVLHARGEKAPWLQQLDRIEQKLDALLAALSEDEPERPTHDMDGNAVPVVQGEARSL